jgi:hypothetical protein
MKTSGLCIAIIAVLFWVDQNSAHAQSIASAANISTSETPGDLKQLESLWKLVLAKSPDGQFLLKNLSGDRDHVLAAILRNVEESDGVPQLLGMTPRAAIVGIFPLKDPNIEPTFSTSEDVEVHLQNVRNQAKSLVTCYRDYVKLSRALLSADGKLAGKQDAERASLDAASQLEWDYELRKAQRDIDQLVDDLNRTRRSLTDLVGFDAVRQIDEKLAGSDYIRPLNQVDRFKRIVDPVAPAHLGIGNG